MLDGKLMRFAAAMSSAALTQGVLIFLGYWGGSRLDASLGSKPLAMIVMMVLGGVMGLWYFVVIFKKTKP